MRASRIWLQARGLRQTETAVFKGTNKILHSARSRREEHFPHRKLKQNYLLLTGSWRAFSGGVSWQGLTTGVGELENPPWCKPSWSSPLALLRSCRPHGWVTSGQTTTREGVQLHPPADSWFKALLSKALTTRARPSFFHHQSIPLRCL